MFCMLRKKKYILLMFQNIIQIVKSKLFLMILNGDKRARSETLAWRAKASGQQHYLAVENLSAQLKGITTKIHGDFYCLTCFRSFATKKKLQSHKRIFKNKDFCKIIMPSEETKYYNLINIKNLIKRHLLFMQILSV